MDGTGQHNASSLRDSGAIQSIDRGTLVTTVISLKISVARPKPMQKS